MTDTTPATAASTVQSASDREVTDRFVRFVDGLTLQAVPEEVLVSAKMALLDYLGVTLAGSAESSAAALLRALRPASGAATLIGHRRSASVEIAALVNGVAAHALDFDDYLAEGVIHATAPLAATVLSLAEEAGSSGAELLEAFIAGYEVHAHLAALLGHPLIHRGFHPTAVLTTVGCAVAAGRLLGLRGNDLAMCIGMAATQAAGLLVSFGTMSKPLHSGKAAANGVLAARLASAGFSGALNALDGGRGLPVVLAGVEDASGLGRELGERWLILDNAIKPYAACGAIHAAIDAALILCPEVVVDDLVLVECAVSAVTIHAAGIAMPTSGLEAKFSTAYAVASALVRGSSTAADFTDRALQDTRVMALASRVEMVETFERITEAAVSVTSTNGAVTTVKIDWAKGSPGNPMTHDDNVEKFLTLVGQWLTADVAAQVVAALQALDRAPDVGGLMALFAD